MNPPSGHLQVIEKPGPGQQWVALWRDAEGRHKKKPRPGLGARGRTTDGRDEVAGGGRAQARRIPHAEGRRGRAAQLLAAAPREKLPAIKRHTFGEACAEWLRYIEFDRERRPSTLGDYRNTVKRYLLPPSARTRPVGRITTDDIDAFREHLLFERKLSRRTAQKILVLLHGILKRAKRKKWIDSNPAEDAERITLKRSGDFNVLSPEEVEAVARAAVDEQDAAIFTTAAFSGLRLGELRALRWADLDFAGERIVVRKGVTRWQEGRPSPARSAPSR